MKSLIFIMVLFPALVVAKKCTNPTSGTNRPTEGTRPTEPQGWETTTPFPIVETTESIETTTPYYPPPEYWPKGKWALLQAGGSCPDFFRFKKGSWYQDSEDTLNGNRWTTGGAWPGVMKQDGYQLHYCTKIKSKAGIGAWPAGDYCIHRVGSKCPTKQFKTGSIKWDDENNFNANKKAGTLPTGVYKEDTTQFFCCRNDSSASLPIDLPVTKDFYLYKFSGETCQKVRGMTVTEEIILFDDEDDESNDNQNNGFVPLDSGSPINGSGSPSNHRLHYCHYQRK